jgi:hypothetical protein
VIREQKQWGSRPPWCASRQYRIYSDNARGAHFSRRVDFLRGTQVTEFVPNKLDKSSGVAEVVGLLNCVAEDGKRALLACHVTAIGAERSTIASAS